MTVKEIISEIIKKKKGDGGIKEVYFVGCGGSLGAFYPAKVFLETESVSIRTGWYNSNEFIHNTPKVFGKNTVVITASHRGNTPETVKAAELAHKAGISVVALTWSQDSPITKVSDYVVSYSFGDDKDIAQEKTIVGLMAAVEILNQSEGYDNYDDFLDGVKKIDGIVKQARKHVEKRAEAFAEEYKNDKVIYTMGSGAGYGAAYMESICIFMEMQWINSSSIHTGEYFHGPFEITDSQSPFMIQISEGPTRELDVRALEFLKKYGKRFEVLDAKDLGLSTIPASVISYFNHSLFNNVYDVYNHALADSRQHPLSTRRYMWKVEY
ncbi:SIS domain-containing protein [Lacrimispora sp.]|uniref:SIS domain-containing protein n=1 Tax=Lacrimispora sp. TaxID=2719234 RepID=UPI003995F211